MQLICPKCEMQVEIEDDGMPEKRRPVRCTSAVKAGLPEAAQTSTR